MEKPPDEIPKNGIDDDNNGYVDDIYGINTTYRRGSIFASGNVMITTITGLTFLV